MSTGNNPFGNTDAKCAANFMAQRSADTHYHGALYHDGIVLYLAVDADTADKWAAAFPNAEYDQSDDCSIWVFILRGAPDLYEVQVAWIGERIHSDWHLATLQDNRHMDHNTIDWFMKLVRRTDQTGDE
jgi:hypothetical protein